MKADCFKNGNEPIKGEQVSDYQLVQEESALWS